MDDIKKYWLMSDPAMIGNLEESMQSYEELLKVPRNDEEHKSEEYKQSLLKLQHLAFDLEDILDHLKAIGNDASCLQRVKRFLALALHCFPCDSGDLPSRIDKMKQTMKASPLKDQRDNLHQLESEIREEDIPLRENAPLGEKRMVGREKQKKDIRNMLLQEGPSKENCQVICIVGGGGLGKTTLVQYAYNDHEVNARFEELKLWVSKPDAESFDLKSVMTTLINLAEDGNHTFKNFESTHNKLLEVVKGKRFLIVFDDVWTVDAYNWEKLMRPLQFGAKGSKVIVTTRQEGVANTTVSEIQKHNIIPLEPFSGEESWLLFQWHAGLASHNDLSEMKSEIITKCNGLPLAAKALGCLFRKEREEWQRRDILSSNIWVEESKVSAVLRLSYFHLSSHLKLIFSFFALFPKGYKFGEMEIIWLWMAQGMLIPRNQQERMETLGHWYLLELVSSSLLERSSTHDKHYVMHDLVHDLSVWAAGDICLRLTNTPQDPQQQKQIRRARHLNLCTDLKGQLPCVRQLRTFIGSPEGFHDKHKIKDFISRLRSIRTLYLASSTIEELPECIGDLKFLQLLDLQFEKITSLPESIGRLYNLQVLLLADCINLKEVMDFGSLVKLRHVRFPESLWKAMPPGISKLTDLQTLGDMYIGVDHGRGSMIRELKSLNHLHGELTLLGLQYVKKVKDAREMHLDEKLGLENLRLFWPISKKYFYWFFGTKARIDRGGNLKSNYELEQLKYDNNDIKEYVLEQLKPNNGCIKEFELYGYMGLTWPSWLGDPSFKKMVAIRLVMCHKLEKLPPLGQLPSLKKLRVEKMDSFRGFHDNIMEKFPCLEELVIKGCVSFQGSLPPVLPRLKILKIKDCPLAKVSLPSSPNPKFELLQVKRCHALLSTTTDMLAIHCSEKMSLWEITSGFTSLEMDGPCSQGLFIDYCDSLVSIEKIPMSAKTVRVDSCGKLQRVEWEGGASAASASNNNAVVISDCNSILRVGNIPLVVAQLYIRCCSSLEDVTFTSSEATDGDSYGPSHQSGLVELAIQNCPKLTQQLWIQQTQWIHLKFLKIKDIGESGDSIECIKGTDIKGEKVEDDTSSILHLPSRWLRELEIGGFRNLKNIKCSTFPNLTQLRIEGSRNFASLKDGDDWGQLQAAPIQKLTIKDVDAINPVQEWGLELLIHLQHLTIGRIRSRWDVGDLVESLVGTVDDDTPSSTTPSLSRSPLYLPSFSLTSLDISDDSDQIGCFSDLKSINCSTFPNLTQLWIYDCPKLESLGPNNHLPPNLKDVLIIGCPLIEQQCTSDPTGVIRFYIRWKPIHHLKRKAGPLKLKLHCMANPSSSVEAPDIELFIT